MKKETLIPEDVLEYRRRIDAGVRDGSRTGFAEPLDDDTFLYLWAAFAIWLKSLRSEKHNDDISGDESRLKALETEAAARGLPFSARDATIALVKKLRSKAAELHVER